MSWFLYYLRSSEFFLTLYSNISILYSSYDFILSLYSSTFLIVSFNCAILLVLSALTPYSSLRISFFCACSFLIQISSQFTSPLILYIYCFSWLYLLSCTIITLYCSLRFSFSCQFYFYKLTMSFICAYIVAYALLSDLVTCYSLEERAVI